MPIIKDSWPHIIEVRYLRNFTKITSTSYLSYFVTDPFTLSYSSTLLEFNSQISCASYTLITLLTCIHWGSCPYYSLIHPEDQFPWTITSIYNVLNTQFNTFDQKNIYRGLILLTTVSIIRLPLSSIHAIFTRLI